MSVAEPDSPRWVPQRQILKEPTGRGAHAAITVGEPQERISMTLTVAHLRPIVSLIVGLLILIVPRLLNYIVARDGNDRRPRRRRPS